MSPSALIAGSLARQVRLAAHRSTTYVNLFASLGFALTVFYVGTAQANAQSGSAVAAPVKSDAPSVEKTSDGRAFSSLSEKEVDALPRSEKRAYYAWKNAALDGELARVTAENAALGTKQVQLVTAKWGQVAPSLQRM